MRQERWLVTGASGQLGGHLLGRLVGEVSPSQILALAGKGELSETGVQVARIDLADPEDLRGCVAAHRPTHLLHVGAMTSVAEGHARLDDAHRINVEATHTLAQAARSVRARFVFSSTDMVFDGEAAPYREDDPPSPISHYGRTKAEAERVAADFDDTLVVRMPLMYGFARGPRHTTFAQQVAALHEGRPLRLFTDEFRTPIWLADAATALIALARSNQTGIIHLAGPQRLSRYEMVEHVARLLNIPEPQLVPTSRLSIDAPEPRPADLSLDGTRFVNLFPNLAPGPIRAEVFGAATR